MRCSRASIRSRRRSNAIPAASRSPSTRCATRSTSARGSASPRPSSPAASSPGDKIRVYVQKAQHFALPADPNEADHHDRARAPASRRSAPSCRSARRPRRPGRNWLYFGHQRSDFDFFYEDELIAMRKARPSHAPDARLVARRRRENLRAAPHARRRPRHLGLARATARISMFAATRCAWRRTSNAR